MGKAGTPPGQTASRLLTQGRLDAAIDQQRLPVLRGLVAAACQLTGGGIGVALLGNADRKVVEAASFGPPGRPLETPGDLPGLDAFLAALLVSPQPLLLNEVRAHQARHCIPSGHPRVASLVGAPVRTQAGLTGYLYVAHEREGADFSADDVRTLACLASAAGLAVDVYHLVTDLPTRLRWLDAIAEMVHLLRGDVGREEGLEAVAGLLLAATGADSTAITHVRKVDDGPPGAFVEAAAGLGSELMNGAYLPSGHFLATIMGSAHPVEYDVAQIRSPIMPAEWRQTLSVLGPGLAVPLGTTAEPLGAIFLAWRPDSPHASELPRVSTLTIPFARTATLLLQRHEAQLFRTRQQRWADTSAEVTRLLLTDVEPHQVMARAARRIREISWAAYAAVVLANDFGPPGTVTFDVVDGLGLENTSGTQTRCPSPLDEVIGSGVPLISTDMVHDDRFDLPPELREAFSVLGLTMLMPLRSAPGGDRGALIVAWRRGSSAERAARDDAPLLESFADQFALALQRARANEERDRRQRWLEACSELTRRLASDRDQEATIRRVMRLLRRVSGADFGAIIKADPTASEAMSLVIVDGYGVRRHYSHHLISNSQNVRAAIRSGRAVVSEDFVHDPAHDPPPEMADNLATIGLTMIIPMAAGEVSGALFAGWRRGSPHERFARHELALLETFADNAALAMQRTQVLDERDRGDRWLVATSEMARLLIGQVDRDEAMALVIRQLRLISGADVGGILLVDPTDSSSLRVAGFEGIDIPPVAPDARIPRGGLAARAIATGQGIVSEDYAHHGGHDPPAEWRDAVDALGLGMMMPLVAADEDEVLGVLFAGWRRDSPSERLARHEVQEIRTFADLASLALQRVRTQDDRVHLRMLQDHEQIAHELHDAVLQRLFAVGLRLHGAASASAERSVSDRVEQAIQDLDQTTAQVRQTIKRLAGDDTTDPTDTTDATDSTDSAGG
ncbi:hypothetical protein GCM10023317_08220 [Actinopolymorpha pittospori]